MKQLLTGAAVAVMIAGAAVPAQARGCLEGALVSGVAGTLQGIMAHLVRPQDALSAAMKRIGAKLRTHSSNIDRHSASRNLLSQARL